ncbi:porin family protein [Aquimarina mytili]
MAQTSNAQVESFQMGFKFGLNVADLLGDQTSGFDPRTIVHVGLAAEIPINEYLAVQPELLYSFQGVKYDSEEPNFDDEILKLDYIYLPVMVKYYPFYVVPGFSIEVGPQVGYLAAAVRQLKNSIGGGTEKSDIDVKDIISDVDYGANFGLGYQFEMGAFFQARYSLGLANIVDDEANDTIERQHSVVQLSVGVKF